MAQAIDWDEYERVPYEEIEQTQLPGYAEAHPQRPALPYWAGSKVPTEYGPSVTQYSNLAMDLAERLREGGIPEQSWMPPEPPPKPKKTLAKFTNSFNSSNFGGRDPHKYDVAGDSLVRFSRLMPKEEGAYYKAIGKVKGDPLTQGEKKELYAVRRQTRQQANGLAREERDRRISMLSNAQNQFKYDLQLERQEEDQKVAQQKARIVAQKEARLAEAGRERETQIRARELWKRSLPPAAQTLIKHLDAVKRKKATQEIGIQEKGLYATTKEGAQIIYPKVQKALGLLDKQIATLEGMLRKYYPQVASTYFTSPMLPETQETAPIGKPEPRF